MAHIQGGCSVLPGNLSKDFSVLINVKQQQCISLKAPVPCSANTEPPTATPTGALHLNIVEKHKGSDLVAVE